MKDDTCGVPIKSFTEVNPKMYTFIIEDNHESKKAKGSKTNVNDDELKYENYKYVLFNRFYNLYNHYI